MPPARRSARATRGSGLSPFEAGPAPVLVLAGTDQALADVAARRVERALRTADPALERHVLDTATASAGDLLEAVAPSLFGGRRLVAVTGLEAAAGPLAADLLAVAAAWGSDPHDDVCLVARHAGGAGGKAVLAALRALPGTVDVDCAPPAGDRARAELARACARSLGTALDEDAVTALVEATGTDTAELLALVGQLADTTEGRRVTGEDAAALVGGRRETGGFDVADALVSGDPADGLALLRRAQAQRVEPVLVIGAIGAKLRTMARVAAAGRGAPASLARDLALPPWQVERAQRDLRHWTPAGLAEALVALAEADAAVKGEEGAVPGAYALDRAALAVWAAREGQGATAAR